MKRALVVPAVVLALVAAGCSDGRTEPEAEDPQAVLAQAKSVLDEATSVHVVVTSEGVPPGATGLRAAEGVAARPAAFDGELEVSVGGSLVTVGVISIDGTVYAKTPFGPDYAPTDPAQFGLSDPAELLDDETGVSSLLPASTDVRFGSEARVDGEVVREISAEIPGDVVEAVLTSADPATPVQAVFSIATETGELRGAELTGPFFDEGTDSTYTIVLDGYGEPADISAPTTG
ncbi:MAG TPA: LppX_LprAFG lipoprotein [Actinomycetales bacterium]|nr:LppX_LprAFG lipoprotein [Actinomycetales bacterium]